MREKRGYALEDGIFPKIVLIEHHHRMNVYLNGMDRLETKWFSVKSSLSHNF